MWGWVVLDQPEYFGGWMGLEESPHCPFDVMAEGAQLGTDTQLSILVVMETETQSN